MRYLTRIVRAGHGPDPLTGAVSMPIYATSTYAQTGPNEHKGYDYSRTVNPTRRALEDAVADLEGGARGLAFASGMAALTTVLMLLGAGDHIIAGDDCYGGTFRLIDKVYRRFGLEATFTDLSDPDNLAKALTPRTRAVLAESPTNPLLKVTDLRRVADFCRAHGLLFIVDNTFMSPYFQRPLELGADIVWHSATKYLAGHADVVAGALAVRDAALGERLHFLQNAAGAVLGPNDAFLVLRGLKTLGLRMERHDQNARALAAWLREHPKVRRVCYPGLPDHPGHAVHKGQASGFSGMLSFEVLDGGLAERLVRQTKLFILAESLGGVESLIELPAAMTHASIPREVRLQVGVADGLIRLSVGIEDVEDLKEDLAAALES